MTKNRDKPRDTSPLSMIISRGRPSPKLLGLEGGGVKGKSIALFPGVRTCLVALFGGETGKIAGAGNMSHFVVVRCKKCASCI